MIIHGNIKIGDQLKIVGKGAPGFAEIGEVVEAIEIKRYMTGVKNSIGQTAAFYDDCGASRLELYKKVEDNYEN